MEKIKSPLDDYTTFDKLAIVDLSFLKEKFSQDVDTLTKSASRGKSEEFSDNLSDDDKLSLALYGYHVFISEENELKQSINALKNYYETFCQKDDLNIFIRYISYIIKKTFLFKNKIYKDGMPIILSKPLKLKKDIKKIKFIVPMVPTKSPFTIYIISLLNDGIKRLSVDNIDFEIEIGWNMSVYSKVTKNLSGHFDFDKNGLMFEKLKYYIEQNFQSTVNTLILNSQWGYSSEKEIKMNILRNKLKYVKEQNYKLEGTGIDSRISHMQGIKGHVMELILKDIKEYSPKDPEHIINYLGTLIINQCRALEEGIILFITPLPVALVLDYSLKLIKEIEAYCEKIYFLCYLPFPGSDDIRKNLPFYLFPYSYYRYQKSKKTDDEKLVLDEKLILKEKYVHRLLVDSIKSLNTDLFDISAMENFVETVDNITIFFRKEDDKLNEYMRYI